MSHEITPQSEELPSHYNQDERERKIEQERQLVEQTKKIDELLLAVKGDRSGSILGFSNRLLTMEHSVHGTEDSMGIATKVAIMWKAWIWVLCTASGLASSALTLIVLRVIGKI